MEPVVSPRIYRFGPFELSRDSAELRKSGVRLKLPEQPFQILCTLLDHPGELVTREQLQQQLWSDGTFVDFEHGLNTAVKRLRDVLSDDADTPRYIETIPRKGYRFIAPLDGKAPTRGTQSVPLPTRKTLWVWLTVIGLLILFGAFWVWREISPAPRRIIRSTQLTFSGMVEESWMPEFNSSIQTDGRRIFFSDAHHKLQAVGVNGGRESPIASELPAVMLLHISPDGSTLLLRNLLSAAGGSEGPLWLLPANGGAPRCLGDIEGQDAAFSPDGKAIAVTRGDALYITDERGSDPRKLLTAPGRPFWPRWSPDRKRLRYTVVDPKTRNRMLWETTLDGSSRPLLSNWKGDACCGIWSSDGKSYFFINVIDRESDLWVLSESGIASRRSRPTRVSFAPVGVQIVSLTAAPGSNRLFVTGRNQLREVFAFDSATKRVTELLPGIHPVRVFFSRDGEWATVLQRGILWRSKADGSELLQLTSPPLRVAGNIAVSPDASRIAFDAKSPDQQYKVYWVSAQGGEIHEVAAAPSSQQDPNWSSDGQSIIFGESPHYYAESGKAKAIYISNLKNHQTTKLPDSEGWFSPRISPDGRSLAALSIDQKRLGLFTFEHSLWRELARLDMVDNPFWSPDGQWIYFNDSVSVWRVSVRDSRAEKVLTMSEVLPGADCFPYASAPSGSLLFNCLLKSADLYALDWE